jgi:hypothetical protein
MERKLAKITGAKLELQERGILNFWIFVDYEDGFAQGIGGIALDQFDKSKDRRVGTAYGCEMIRRILETLSVNDFSEMKGQIIWVHGNGSGFSFNPKGIEPLSVSGTRQPALIFEDVLNEFPN